MSGRFCLSGCVNALQILPTLMGGGFCGLGAKRAGQRCAAGAEGAKGLQKEKFESFDHLA